LTAGRIRWKLTAFLRIIAPTGDLMPEHIGARAAAWARRWLILRTAPLRFPASAAIIGFGVSGMEFLHAMTGCWRVHLKAVADPCPRDLAVLNRAAPHARTYRDYRTMLAEVRPRIVCVCTWPALHASITLDCARAGVRGVICEKPLALSMAEIDEMRSACLSSGTKLAVGQQHRFDQSFNEARRRIAAGAIGEIRTIRACVGSSLANGGAHLFDIVRFIAGDLSAKRVRCECTGGGSRLEHGLPIEDEAAGWVEFDGGLRCVFEAGPGAGHWFRLDIEGSEGALGVDPENLSIDGCAVGLRPWSNQLVRRKQMQRFSAWVAGARRSYDESDEEGARAAELIIACYESARTGGPVDLPFKGRSSTLLGLYPASPAVPCSPPPAAGLPFGSTRLAADGGGRSVSHWFSNRPVIGPREILELSEVVLMGRLSRAVGTAVRRLEMDLAAEYDTGSAIACSSGTAAIHIALGALGIGPGDEVVTTPVTDIGTVQPILALGAIPVFADIDPLTGLITPESVLACLTSRTRAVIAVHLFGRPARVGAIRRILEPSGIALVEDCAQAHFAEAGGRPVGTTGEFGCFSLQQSKQITCGDGGFVLVGRPDLAERARLFADKGWDRTRQGRSYLSHGLNYRMTEMQGAVAIGQLARGRRLTAARSRTAEALRGMLEECRGIHVPAACREGDACTWWAVHFAVAPETGIPTDEMRRLLEFEGIRASAGYIPRPIPREEFLLRLAAERGWHRQREAWPGAESFLERTIVIYWSSRASMKHARGVASAVGKILGARC
jgi:perosamine synthetase